MKFQLVFLMTTCLVLTGIPRPSQSEINPKALSKNEKAVLTALARTNLLSQKAGDGSWPINTKKGNEKANADGQKKDEKPSGISETGGILIILGAVGAAIGAILLVAASHSGSC